jgi:predicted nucleic-acid-binding Zn-ribbon protein
MHSPHPIQLDIQCPKCKAKANFHSELVGSGKLYPEPEGRVTCLHCGYNAPYHFTGKEYYYQIPVGKRMLVAQNRERLIQLRDYFDNKQQEKPRTDPELDFPGEVYRRRKEIVEKISQWLREDVV